MSSVPRPHVALFPAAGMGHLMPFLHLAALLSRHGCVITLITAQPTTSESEASHIRSFLSAQPEAQHLVLELIPIPQGLDVANADPFFLQTERMNRSVPQLHPFLKELSPPLSAVFSDLFLVAAVAEVAEELGLPMYIPYTSSARFYALFLHLPELTSSPDFLRSGESEITVPGVPSFPVSSIPPAFADNSNLFTMTLVRNSKAVSKARGVIMNNFEWFESSTLAALNSGQVLESLPPSIPVGPYEPYSLGKGSAEYLPWLNSQLVGSVVYLSFGSRTAISKQQIRELANALKRGVTKFLWSVKTSKVDKDDKEDLKNVLGDGFLEETAGKGFTLKKWVDQGEILAHPAVGGFVSHCGWNSVMEAAREGVPILAWPLHGDQRVNAELVMDTGLGIWDVGWGIGNQTLVQAEEIETKISKLMNDEKLKETARRVKEEAANAVVSGGSSNQMIRDLLKCLSSSLLRK